MGSFRGCAVRWQEALRPMPVQFAPVKHSGRTVALDLFCYWTRSVCRNHGLANELDEGKASRARLRLFGVVLHGTEFVAASVTADGGVLPN